MWGIMTAISKHFLINPIDLEEEADYLSDADDGIRDCLELRHFHVT